MSVSPLNNRKDSGGVVTETQVNELHDQLDAEPVWTLIVGDTDTDVWGPFDSQEAVSAWALINVSAEAVTEIKLQPLPEDAINPGANGLLPSPDPEAE